MSALRRRDAVAARQAVQDDMIEGGVGLVELMEKIETGEAALVEGPDGALQLSFRADPKRKVRQGAAGRKSISRGRSRRLTNISYIVGSRAQAEASR